MISWWRHRAYRRAAIDVALELRDVDETGLEELRRHLDGCAACREEQAQVRAVLAAASSAEIAEAEPPIDGAVLVRRIQAAIDRGAVSRASGGSSAVVWIPAAAALAAVAILGVLGTPPAPPAPPTVAVSIDALDRMERAVDREQTVRYLQEAQGVLVSVSTTLPRCDRAGEHREVAAEAGKSRELLARRRLLVDDQAEHLAAARGLLEDVDRVLADVAALDGCAQAGELRAIVRRIAAERLLMKIDVTTRELQG
jgi:hypothetical protein